MTIEQVIDSESQQKLDRFFSKLLGEVQFFQADLVEFVPDRDVLKVVIKKSNTELKTSSIKISWQKHILDYLRARVVYAEKATQKFNWISKIAYHEVDLNLSVLLESTETGTEKIVINGFSPAKSTIAKAKPGKASRIEKIEVADDFFLTKKTTSEQEAKDIRPAKVLVVEDDPDQRSIIEMVLKNSNYEVLHAGDGEEALKIMEDNELNLVITDLMMPRMDGYALVKNIKSHKQYANVPILVLTALDDEEKEYKLLSLGADDYCEKTVQRKILLKRVENLIQRSKNAMTK